MIKFLILISKAEIEWKAPRSHLEARKSKKAFRCGMVLTHVLVLTPVTVLTCVIVSTCVIVLTCVLVLDRVMVLTRLSYLMFVISITQAVFVGLNGKFLKLRIMSSRPDWRAVSKGRGLDGPKTSLLLYDRHRRRETLIIRPSEVSYLSKSWFKIVLLLGCFDVKWCNDLAKERLWRTKSLRPIYLPVAPHLSTGHLQTIPFRQTWYLVGHDKCGKRKNYPWCKIMSYKVIYSNAGPMLLILDTPTHFCKYQRWMWWATGQTQLMGPSMR